MASHGGAMQYTEYFLALLREPSVSGDNPLVLQVLHELVEAISELRIEYCHRYYGEDYIFANIYARQVLEEMLPGKIHFGEYIYMAPPPPPSFLVFLFFRNSL